MVRVRCKDTKTQATYLPLTLPSLKGEGNSQLSTLNYSLQFSLSDNVK
jgi:hypothetical protein